MTATEQSTSRQRARRLLLRAVSVAALALAVVVAWSRAPAGSSSSAVDPALRQTFDDGEIQFDYPLGWDLYPIQASSTGFGQTSAILGNRPFRADCRGVQDDINCFYQRPLEPGTISVEIGSRSLMTSTIFDLPPPDPQQHAVARRGVVSGVPAVMVDYGDMGPDDFYHVDLRAEWMVARPDSPSQVRAVAASIRGPGVAQMRSQLDALIGSLRFDKAPVLLPSDPAALVAAGRTVAAAAIQTLGANAKKARAADSDDRSVYDCFAAAIDHPVTVPITLGSWAALGGTVEMACNVAIEPAGSIFWRVTLTAVSGGGSSRPGAIYRETKWLTAGGVLADSSTDGDLPGALLPKGAIDRAAARRALATALGLGQDGPDFYACFSPEPGTSVAGTISTGPDGTTPYHDVAVTCTSRVTAAPDRTVYIVTLTASWRATADHEAGSLTATLRVGADNSTGNPEITGDRLP